MYVLEILAPLIRLGVLPLKYILSRLTQSLKQELPNEVTDEGIVIEVKQRQNMKHLSPNVVTDGGIVIEVKPLQP